MTERRQTNTLETLVRQATQGVYEVDGVIGQGGMATVYRAVPLGDVPTGRDAASDDAVALKVLLPQFAGDPEYARRFEREARAAAGLDHPSVVRVLDVGEVGGMPYMAMELLEGPDLHRLLSARREAGHGPLPATTAARLLAPVAAALDHAHGRGLVHRDVKSSNVIVVGASVLDDELSGARAVLTDFGIAHAAGGTRLTQTGTALGTAAYMAPEQARATGVDGRSDVWSLGVVLYEAVTGRLPFGGESGTGTNPMATVYRVLHEAAVPVGEAAESAGVGALPEWYRAVVGRCLRKNPDERFQSADELAQALEAGAVGDVATCIAIAGPAERGESAHGTPGEQESSGETEIWQAEVQASDTKDAPGSSIAKKKYAPMMSEHRRREERRRTWTRRALFAVGGVLILGLIYGIGVYSAGNERRIQAGNMPALDRTTASEEERAASPESPELSSEPDSDGDENQAASEEGVSVLVPDSKFVFHGCTIEIGFESSFPKCTISKDAIAYNLLHAPQYFSGDMSVTTWGRGIDNVRNRSEFEVLKRKVESLLVEEHSQDPNNTGYKLGHFFTSNGRLTLLHRSGGEYRLKVPFYRDESGGYVEEFTYIIISSDVSSMLASNYDESLHKDMLIEAAENINYTRIAQVMNEVPSLY